MKILHFKLLILLFCSTVASCSSQQQKQLAVKQTFYEDLQESNHLAETWFKGTLRTKGLFRYYNWPVGDKYSKKNNAIRQLMASRLLAEYSQEDPKLVPLHQKNLDFLIENWYKKKENLAYIFYNKKSKLGANAMMLRTLVASPLFDQYKKEARLLYNGIASLIQEDDSLQPFFIAPDYDYDPDYLLTFYSGEAIVAMIEYANKIVNPTIMKQAADCQIHYIYKYVNQLDQNYYPAYVPWHSISLNKLYKVSKQQKYVDAIFALNDKLLEMQDKTDFIGRFYNPSTPQYGSPHASSDGVYTEGLAYAYEVALLEKDLVRTETYFNAIQLSLKNLRSLQYTEEQCKEVKHPERCTGGFQVSTKNEWIRIDCGQHILDAYRKLLEIKELSLKTATTTQLTNR